MMASLGPSASTTSLVVRREGRTHVCGPIPLWLQWGLRFDELESGSQLCQLEGSGQWQWFLMTVQPSGRLF